MENDITPEDIRTIELATHLAPIRAGEYEREGVRTFAAVNTYPPIDSQQLAEQYAAEVIDVKTVLRNIKAEQVKITAPLNAALEAAYEFFRRARQPYEQAELVLKGHIGMWQLDQRNKQEQAQREAETAAQMARTVLRQEADAKEAAGDGQQALELRQAADMTPTPVVVTMNKLAGISVGGTWHAEVLTKRALIEFVAAHPEYDDGLEVKQSFWDGLARSLKDKLGIPGIEPRFRPRVAARAKP